jgi:hypothetical protein
VRDIDDHLTHRTHWSRGALPGQVLIIFALASLVLVGGLAISIDAGFLMAERRQVQSAADAAALAAAVAAHDGKSSSEVLTTGQNYGAFNADVATGNVTVSRPPTSGAHAGDNDYIQVTVSKNVTRYFVGAIYSGAWAVSASATAGIEGDDFDAAILALNSDAGGIRTNGNTTIRAIGGSIMSNYDLNTNGNTNILADGWVNSNDGFHTSGNTVINGTLGENSAAAEIPDPLAHMSAPTLPAFPGNPVPTVSPSSVGCRDYPGSPSATTVSPGLRNSGGSSCINLNGNVPAITFSAGNWRFTNSAAINISGNITGVTFTGGGGTTYNFVGGNGISGSGNLTTVNFGYGNYSFANGASMGLSGNINNVNIAGGNWYFNGGGGLTFNGNTNATFSPGTYIFDGGAGLTFNGNSRMTMTAGAYYFYFRNGADFDFNGNTAISLSGSPYAYMYFYQGSDMLFNGNTSFSMPSGEYYFDNATLQNNGNTLIRGSNVFLYFKNGGYAYTNGNSSWQFSAPTSTIYTGYVPGVFMFSDRANTSTFTWNGNSSATSTGAIYLPSSPLNMNGNQNGRVLDGQLIIDRLYVNGNTNIQVQYHEYAPADTTKVYLVE